MATIDYYEDSTQWGNYQYTTIDDIINNYIMSMDDDDYTFSVPRYKILYQAMRGLREFYYDILQEVKAMSLELSPQLTVNLPPDYVRYTRISWIDDDGNLRPMAIDSKMPMAKDYLQDNEYDLLFDNDGNILEAGVVGKGESSTISSSELADSDLGYYGSCYSIVGGGFAANLNMSNVFTNGKYNIDKEDGVIYFGSGAESLQIVLEYISDGLYQDTANSQQKDLRVHKFAEDALIDYIHYTLIKNRRNVPYNEKMRARKEFYNSRRIAKARLNAIKKAELIQTFKGSTKWIK